MRIVPEQQAPVDAPLYVRWGPDRSPFAIEMKLDLVPQITEELDQAESTGMEIGGVLIGYFTSGTSPILRIDEYEMIPRGPDDGAIYMLDPNQREQFLQISRAAAGRDKTVVGFFRSHFRPGPMRPSLADRSLLSGELKRPNYTLLLIQASQPRRASFFIASEGQLPGEASVEEFQFLERGFLELPEVEAEGTGYAEELFEPEPRRSGAYMVYTLLVAAVLIAGAWWWTSGNGPEMLRRLNASSNQINLAITPEGSLLRITWNHAATEISRAQGATLIIDDGPKRRGVILGADDLKLGAIVYRRESGELRATLDLNLDGALKQVQSVEWAEK